MNDRTLCTVQSITMPKGGDVQLIPPPPKPCVTIIVHGVNDLGVGYSNIENGLCQGLNERLDLSAKLPNGMANPGYMIPAQYSLPTATDNKAEDPDAVYYRRKFSGARSTVIPFYWGFREEEEKINKTAPHGEWLDRNGNRLDKAGTKEGGQFVNATTNLVDMWGEGFNGKLFGFISLDALGGTMTHPLFSAAGRRYMVLAAKRLAMLIKIIRKRYPNDTINIVGHSQGTMLGLLSQAFLYADQVAPVDALIMFNSPYSLIEPFTEKFQGAAIQQTTEARIATLKNIIDFICGKPNPQPPLPSLALHSCKGYGAIGGPAWKGEWAAAKIDGQEHHFKERDNRGSVYLYFTPQDQTVGLANVQGIGWQGIADKVKGRPARSILHPGFHQRVFTTRLRGGKKETIGEHVPPYKYVLRYPNEETWEDTGLPWLQKTSIAHGDLDKNAEVILTAPTLPLPTVADFNLDGRVKETGKSGVSEVLDTLDPVDAAIAVSNGGWDGKREVNQYYPKATAYKYGEDIASVERALNEGQTAAHQTGVLSLYKVGVPDQVLVVRTETPYEARLRLQSPAAHEEQRSFHSAIPNNPEHSRRVLAYDLAIGAGDSVDDPAFYQYLCRVADWRLNWKAPRGSGNSEMNAEDDLPNEEVRALYRAEAAVNRELIDATVAYHKNGQFPEKVSDTLPSLVINQTIQERRQARQAPEQDWR